MAQSNSSNAVDWLDLEHGLAPTSRTPNPLEMPMAVTDPGPIPNSQMVHVLENQAFYQHDLDSGRLPDAFSVPGPHAATLDLDIGSIPAPIEIEGATAAGNKRVRNRLAQRKHRSCKYLRVYFHSWVPES